MDLSLVIVNYKNRRLLDRCLRSIFEVPFSGTREIIVVDNDSQDGTGAMMTELYQGVRCIEMKMNVGFGPAANVGIRSATGRYICIMNPDLVVLSDAFSHLVHYLEEHADVGMVGPQLVNPNGTIQASCYRFHDPLTPVYRRTPLGRTARGRRALEAYLMQEWDHASERDVDWLLGACIVIRKATLDAIGLFDERFFLYFEDTDLCRRVWEANQRIVYLPQAKIIHYHRRESADGSLFASLGNSATRHHVRSWFRYLMKYRGQSIPRTHLLVPQQVARTGETHASASVRS